MKKLFTMLAFVTIVTSIMAQQMHNGHEYVDLGLPSGTLWATCNVGAENPEDYGDYFAWGETSIKESYSWENYDYMGGNGQLTKYCTDSVWGIVDHKTKLERKDDVAVINWGGKWRMPTYSEQRELVNNCVWTWTDENGIKGCKIEGKNGKSMFLPAAGYYGGETCRGKGYEGHFWSSSLEDGNPNGAYMIVIAFNTLLVGSEIRLVGQSVRPVCSSVNAPSSVEQVVAGTKESAQKIIENGQVIIIRDGVRYNALGVRIK